MSDTETVALVIALTGAIAIALWLLLMRRRGTEAAATPPHAAAPPAVATTGRLEITAVHHDSVDDAGEWVQIVNVGYSAVQLAGWRLTDEGEKHSYTFPPVVIEAQQAIRVHMWHGVDDANDLYVGRRQRWWNNEGDTAYLYDREGRLVHTHRYGSAARA